MMLWFCRAGGREVFLGVDGSYDILLYVGETMEKIGGTCVVGDVRVLPPAVKRRDSNYE